MRGPTTEEVSACQVCAGLDPDDLQAALLVARRRGAARAQVFVEHRTSTTLRWENGRMQARTDTDIGAAVRVTAGGVAGFTSTTVVTRAALSEAAGIAAAAAAAGATWPPAAQLVRRHVAPVQRPSRPVTAVDLPAKAALADGAGEAARSTDRRIRSAAVTYVDVTQHVLLADLAGFLTSDARTRTRMTCRTVAGNADGVQAGFEGPGTGGGLELFDAHPPEEIGRRAAERAVRMLGGDRFSADDAVVVLGPGGGGLFLHEACGHGLEADGLVRGTSVYARTTGRRIASPSVTALDDPTLPGGFGSYAVDDEGRPSARTLLIDGGRQVGAVTDGATAGRREAPGTANGRCESFAHRPLCRLSNTYLAPGPDDAADIVRDVARGLYVARLSGGQVDIATGEFAFTSSEAYLIERGELTRPVRNATIVGTGPAALGAVDAVGDDLAFTQALCGKDGQWVPVSYGSPTIRVPGLAVVPS